jgi:alanyl-tRNA synthetase
MHKALREVLGAHVAQKGSLVDPDKTRFDFSHNAPLTAEQIAKVEAHRQPRDPAEPRHRSAAHVVRRRRQAWRDGAVRREVRRRSARARHRLVERAVRRRPRQRTGDIGLFKIINEGGVAAGIRRLEAVTGEGALALVQSLNRRLHEAAARSRPRRKN